MKEIWVPAIYIKFDGTRIDFTGKYEVSNLGRCRSIPRKGVTTTHYMKIHSSSDDYDWFHLSLSRTTSQKCYVERLVISSFNPDGWFANAEANHIDENHHNNNLENIEWLEKTANIRFGTGIKRRTKSLTNYTKYSEPVLMCEYDSHNFIKEFPSINEAERQTGINHSKITLVCQGKRNKAGGYWWTYKKAV